MKGAKFEDGHAERGRHESPAAVPRDQGRGNRGRISDRTRQDHRRQPATIESTLEHPPGQHDRDILVGRHDVRYDRRSDKRCHQETGRLHRCEDRRDQALDDTCLLYTSDAADDN